MKDLQDILRKIRQLDAAGTPYVLATIVQVSGSTYRGPGARMLITREERTVGTLGGGCLETDLVESAGEVFATGEPLLLTYDATSEDDILWGTGLGCRGIARVLLEKLPRIEGLDLPQLLDGCARHRRSGVLATVFAVEGAVQARAGQRLMLHQDLSVEDDIPDEELRRAMQRAAREELDARGKASGPTARGKTWRCELPEGCARVLLEPLLPPISLVVFGAGYDTLPVLRLAGELGWHTTVVDHRPAFARTERLPGAHEVLCARPEEAGARLSFDHRTVVLIMTHNYLQDLELLRHLGAFPVPYLGLLGPRERTQRLLDELKKEGIEIALDQQERLFSPIGLDIGAETAEEIALSVLSEIQAVLKARSGGHLRARPGPIHDRLKDPRTPQR